LIKARCGRQWQEHRRPKVFIARYPHTPGEYIADREVPVPPPSNKVSNIGERILLAFAIDSACYFVFIGGLAAIARKFRDRPAR
jgi:hypothetical protein